MSKLLLMNTTITLLNFFIVGFSVNDSFMAVTCLLPLLFFIAVKIDKIV